MPRPSADITELVTVVELADSLKVSHSWLRNNWKRFKCLRETVSRFGGGRGGGLRWPNTIVGRLWAEKRRMDAKKAVAS